MPTEYSLVFPDGRSEVCGVTDLTSIVDASLAVTRNTIRRDSGVYALVLASALGSAKDMNADKRND